MAQFAPLKSRNGYAHLILQTGTKHSLKEVKVIGGKASLWETKSIRGMIVKQLREDILSTVIMTSGWLIILGNLDSSDVEGN